MKKLLLIAICGIFTIGHFSCVKKIECRCTTTEDGTVVSTNTTSLNERSPSCSILESSNTYNGVVTKVECEEL